jgi:hypothetical protein
MANFKDYMRPNAQTVELVYPTVKISERPFMSDIFVMQRANGDVFALDDHGRFRVPLFTSTRDAFLARSRNFGMLLFKPVQLDTGLLKQLVPFGGAAEVDFWLVSDPLINLNRGRLVQPEQLALPPHSNSNGLTIKVIGPPAQPPQ